MYSTFKNSQFLINGSGILCQDIRFSLDASLEPLVYSQERHGKFLNANEAIGGIVNFSYILTGKDFLKVHLTNEKSPVSGNFGGLYFTSGYLTNYNLNCAPNNAVIVNAEVHFFDALSGVYANTYIRATGTKILNYADVLLHDPSNDGRGGGIGKISGINNIQFTFNSQVDPLYLAGDQLPADVRFGRKELLAVITADVYSGDLPITGKPAGIQVNFTHPELAGTVESFTVSGTLFKREIETSIGDLLKARLYIRQSYSEDIPGISSLSNASAYPKETITINGTNLLNTMFVHFA